MLRGCAPGRQLAAALAVLLALGCGQAFAQALEPGEYRVDADVLNVRMAPADDARIARRLPRGARVDVLQAAGEWARVSAYTEAGDGTREAEWVAAEYLVAPGSAAVPAAPAGTLSAALATSQDYTAHRELFHSVARTLIDTGTCTIADLDRAGGFSRTGTDTPLTYVTYCDAGGRRISVFLDAVTGTVFH